MRVLWLCNQEPPAVAAARRKAGSNKEGWIAGCMNAVLAHREQDGITLAVAFPIRQDENLHGHTDEFEYYGFTEDTNHPEDYDPGLTAALGLICEEFRPDVIHIFGTEYPHCLAMLRVQEWKKRAIVHLQGLMEHCAADYFGGLPEEVTSKASFRDILRRDSLRQQKEKYEQRAVHEAEALKLADTVCGRTAFDKAFYLGIHPDGSYHSLNETLRSCFYEGAWMQKKCRSHSIVVPQGNIPLKGVHVMIEALAQLKKFYPDIRLNVAGDNILRGGGFMNAVKRCQYGKYLRKRIKELELTDNVRFMGQLKDKQMKELYLESSVFVLPSFIENSPNSLGEAMLLGLPCVASRVGGIPSLAKEGEEVRFVEAGDAKALAAAIREIFEYPAVAANLAAAGHKRAMLTYDREANYRMLRWIYESVMKENA